MKMSAVTNLCCSECGNSYSRFDECPECRIPLSYKLPGRNHQEVRGNQNQTVQNSGTIQGGITQKIHITQRAGTELADYKTEIRGYIPLHKIMTKEAWFGGGIALLMSILNITGGLTSILSFFGLTAGQIFFTRGFLWVVTIICGGLAFFTLSIFLGVIFNEKYRHGNSLFQLTGDSTVRLSLTTAECPVDGCSGILNLTKPKPNEEEITLAGICTNKPSLHVFDFDEGTQQGKRLFLTYKRDDKK
jgi:hypothetical protein